MDGPDAAAIERFFERCAQSLRDGRFERIVLAGAQPALQDLARLSARRIELRGQPQLSLVYGYQRRDETRNLAEDDALALLRSLLGPQGFANAHLHTADAEVQLALSRKGRWSLRSSRREAAAAPAPAAHNRDKRRWLDLERPFLAALGVADAQARLVPAMARKWKQINKFVEILDAALAASPLARQQHIEVLDFGAGKGYLTFALHEHLRGTLGRDAQVTGVELRTDLVALCNGIVQRLGLQGLHFEQGDVASRPARAADVMIALHACDTATDHAMHMGVRAGAAIICCAPCCHKQLRAQLLQPQALRPLLRHGVHLGQEAEMLTDALRALLLDACGYDTQVFEFVSLEHTAKNKMVLAVKRASPRDAAAQQALLAQLHELKAFYGVREQCLERLLRADALIQRRDPAAPI
ncbi:MAG TPA: SAM-dependent methyltransferase [Rubrivivax sp.]|nr:SAM-dependent methyltransferase [Rubrivivax sp.]HPO18288.1 SAM-dependent methyltransferase [Rubrivivax sp.]